MADGAPLAISLNIGRFPGGRGLGNALAPSVMGVVMRGVGQLLHGRIIGAFSVGGHHTRGGAKWAPLRFSTIVRKGSTTVLVDTARMRNTILSASTANSVTLSAAAPYAKYHQSGTRRMPQRKVLDITTQDEVWCAEKVRELVNRLINGTGVGGLRK